MWWEAAKIDEGYLPLLPQAIGCSRLATFAEAAGVFVPSATYRVGSMGESPCLAEMISSVLL